MQPGASRPPKPPDLPPAANEIEFVVDVRVEPRDGHPTLVVVKQKVRLESAQIAAVGDPREEVRHL